MGPSLKICPILGSHFPRVNQTGRGDMSHLGDLSLTPRRIVRLVKRSYYVRMCLSKRELPLMSPPRLKRPPLGTRLLH